MKSKTVAFLLWCGCVFLVCGLHRMYVGRWITGAIWLCTFGLLGIGQLVDLFSLGGWVEIENLKARGPWQNQSQSQNVVVHVHHDGTK